MATRNHPSFKFISIVCSCYIEAWLNHFFHYPELSNKSHRFNLKKDDYIQVGNLRDSRGSLMFKFQSCYIFGFGFLFSWEICFYTPGSTRDPKPCKESPFFLHSQMMDEQWTAWQLPSLKLRVKDSKSRPKLTQKEAETSLKHQFSSGKVYHCWWNWKQYMRIKLDKKSNI